MKGGYQDAYYLQLVDFVRRWKGLPEPAVAKSGDTVVYREMTGDCAPRNHRGYDAAGVYTNFTGAASYSVPLEDFGLKPGESFTLEFKWSDNRQSDDPMDFYVNGDAAPRGRMNWTFVFESEK